MTAPLYCDDGASPFDLAASKSTGAAAVTVYIRGTPGGYAHANKARVDQARALGLGVSPNWEAAADYFGNCTVADAQWAGADALAACRALGFPDNGSIACSFSFDFDVPAWHFPAMGAKVSAIRTGLGGHYATMLYGPQALIDWLCANGLATGKHWLMMSTFGHPYNPASPNVCMVQAHDVNGNWISSPVAGTDRNTITDPHALGAWWPTGSPYSSIGDLPMTPAEIQSVADAVWAHNLAGTSNHPAGYWVTNVNALVAQVLAAVKAQPDVTLTDAQVSAIAAQIAAKQPTYTGTLTPTATP
jgi:hypothetical protein